MEHRFQDRIALVTGAASGIGKASAKAFAREGARVACADISKEKLAETVSEIRQDGGTAIAIELNVADSASASAAVEECIQNFGGLQILANVAGILKLEQTHQLSDEDWNRVLGVNLSGTFFMSRAAIPHLLEEKGSIVNVSSLAGLKGQAYGAAYCASKAGVVGLTRVMAVEYAQQGLRVNCVCPGAVDTPLIAGFAPPEGFDPDLINRLSLVPKVTTPDEVAEAIAYLSSPAARSISGVALPIDFGTHAA
ncbi:MAG: SDR family NAD(P)-dependent oxidoreductase [Myxococcota bacterium]|nr:SDR family NAD(P)-dependent oxidoreductase [Myxococcota bacterium]